MREAIDIVLNSRGPRRMPIRAAKRPRHCQWVSLGFSKSEPIEYALSRSPEFRPAIRGGRRDLAYYARILPIEHVAVQSLHTPRIMMELVDLRSDTGSAESRD